MRKFPGSPIAGTRAGRERLPPVLVLAKGLAAAAIHSNHRWFEGAIAVLGLVHGLGLEIQYER